MGTVFSQHGCRAELTEQKIYYNIVCQEIMSKRRPCTERLGGGQKSNTGLTGVVSPSGGETECRASTHNTHNENSTYNLVSTGLMPNTRHRATGVQECALSASNIKTFLKELALLIMLIVVFQIKKDFKLRLGDQ